MSVPISPPLNPRRLRLLDAIRCLPGEWTTQRAYRLYQSAGCGPKRATARNDLKALARSGYLTQHDTFGRRYFTLKPTGS
ncbi:hypothetical protein [Streptomyces roseoverticillatus]|uniref:hypothetical protein n=1 Tax=Streptomyces roseoverticillatus TaxID=66429 RepID=UPI0004C18C3E|nr:hypothetical protein [Streptomyces roseoverticillatus]